MDTEARRAANESTEGYHTPELVVHGDVAALTAGTAPGSQDSAQTSSLPGDTGT